MRPKVQAWTPAVAMMLVSTISYVDRNTLALLSPTILRETHLNNEQYGYIILAFSIAYMLGNPLWGRILDVIGVRRGMTGAVALWTVASMSHVFAAGLRSFAIARAVLGFGEGATFPGGLRTVVQTLTPEQRSRGVAIAYSGGSLGALITPIVITPIAAKWGWHGAFWFTGAIGTLWIAMWALLSRRADLRKQVQVAHAPIRLNDTTLWAFIAAYALGAFPSGFVLYQAANYFSAVMHKTQVEIGTVLWIPPLGWEIGYFFWGWIIDRYARGGASTVGMRRIFLIAMLFGTPLAILPRIPSFTGALAIMFLAMFLSSAFIIGAVAYVTQRSSTGHAGLIAGVGAGSWSAIVGGVMPMIGRLFDHHDYGKAFEIAAAIPILGYTIWRALDREDSAYTPTTKRRVERDA